MVSTYCRTQYAHMYPLIDDPPSLLSPPLTFLTIDVEHYLPLPLVATFLLVGIGFIVAGVLLMQASDSVVEDFIQYDGEGTPASNAACQLNENKVCWPSLLLSFFLGCVIDRTSLCPSPVTSLSLFLFLSLLLPFLLYLTSLCTFVLSSSFLEHYHLHPQIRREKEDGATYLCVLRATQLLSESQKVRQIKK
jgi:hypothetical protein